MQQCALLYVRMKTAFAVQIHTAFAVKTTGRLDVAVKARPHCGFMDGDVLPCIGRSICSAADNDDMEVLGIQARDALRHLHQEVAKDGCV